MSFNEFVKLLKEKITEDSSIPNKMTLGFAEMLIEHGLGSDEVPDEWVEQFLTKLDE